MFTIDNKFCIRVGYLRRVILRKKLRARFVDSMITQYCLDHGLSLITRDHDFVSFQRYADLKLAVAVDKKN